MGSLVEIGMANALLAGVLAIVALLVGRYSRRPALVHSLWLLVLLKLVTPPLVPLPIPWLEKPAPPARVVIVPPPPDEPIREVARAVVEPPPVPPEVAVSPAATMRIGELVRDKDGKKLDMPPPVMPPPAAMPKPAPRVPVQAPVALPSEAPTVKEPETPAVSTAPAEVEEPASSWPELAGLLACVWLGGAALWFLRVAWRLYCFHRLLRYAHPAPESLQHEARRLAKQLGLRRCPGLWLVPGPLPPLLWAVAGRARVYFPESLLKHLEEPGRSTLLVHELAHLRRCDHLVRWLELIVAGLYWWYPLVWLACRQLQAAEEECCDAWVVSELPGYGAAYAGALLETVEFLSRRPAPLPPIASGFGRMHHLKRRLAMIVHGSTPRGLSRTGKMICLGMLATLPMVPTRAEPAAPPTIEVIGEKPPVKIEPAKPVAKPSFEPEEPSAYLNNPRNLQGGGGQVWAAAISPDGQILAVVAGGTGNNEGSLTLWNLATGKEKVTVNEVKPIRCVAYSPDGKTLATGDFNHKVQLRDPATAAVRLVLEGHKGAINSVAFTPDSKTLATGSLDNSVKLWNVADGKNTKTIEAHANWVLSVAISRDGKTLVSTCRDNTAKVWNLPSGKLRHTLLGHTNWVEGAAISADNKTVATTGHDNVVKLWDAASGKLLHTSSGHTGTVNTAVFFPGGKKLATCSHDFTVRLWDVATGDIDSVINTGHEERIYALAITPDGKKIVSGGWDKLVKIWDAVTHQEKGTLKPKRYQPENDYPVLSVACSPDGKTLAVAGEERAIKLVDPLTGNIKQLLEGHEDIVGKVCFSPDGKMLASAGFDGNVLLWNSETGKLQYTLKGHVNWVFTVAFSKDGKVLASGGYDRTIRLWDPKTGKLLDTLKKHKGGVRAIAFSADGSLIASGGTDKSIRIQDAKTKEELYQLKGHDEAVRSLDFSPDGKLLVSGGEDNTVRLWDVIEEKQLALHRSGDVVRDVAFAPRGRSLAVVGQDRTLLVLDPQTLAVRNSFSAHTDAVTSVCYGPDALNLYTGSADRSVRQWGAAREARRPVAAFPGPGKQMWFSLYSPDGKWLATSGDDRVLTVRDARVGQLLSSLDGLTSTVYGMTVSPDGKTLALGCQDMTIKLADIRTAKIKRVLSGHKYRVWSVAFSPDGKRLASAAGSWDKPAEPGEVKVWDLTTGKEAMSLADPAAPVQTVAWSKDGKSLAIGSRDGLARIFDAVTGKARHVIRSHQDGVRSVAFDEKGKYLATGGIDGMVYVHEVESGKEIASLKASASGVNCVAWSPDGKTLAATSKPTDKPETGEVRLWQCDTDEQGKPSFTEKPTLKGHSSWVLTVAFSPDGKTLASAGGTYAQYGEVIVWDLASGKQTMHLSGHRQWVEALAFSKDSKKLFSGGGTRDSRGEVRIWQIDGPGWTVANAHKSSISCAAWSADSKTLATGSYDKTIKLWDAATGKVKGTLTGHDGQMRFLAFRPDGKMLASSNTDKTVKLWDLTTNEERAELDAHRRFVVSLAWSPDGKLLATASADPHWRNQDGEVKVFEVDKGRELPRSEWSNRPALSVVFSHDGKRLITGVAGVDALRIYNVATGKQERIVEGVSSIRILTLSKDGKMLATAHGTGSARGSGSIQVWDTDWKERTTLMGHSAMCLGVGFAADGNWLASASTDGTVKLFDLKVSPAPAVTAKKSAVRDVPK